MNNQKRQPAVVVCPGCGMENPGDSIFCVNDVCRKALGDFRYVLEELRVRSSWSEKLADRLAQWAGKPQFVTVHLAWFAAWMLLNSGLFAFLHAFDDYPYALLGIILAIEAILISSFVLISQNREHAYAEMRAELDYEVSVRCYRKLEHLEQELKMLVQVQHTPQESRHVDQ